jgi:hypothetical protein
MGHHCAGLNNTLRFMEDFVKDLLVCVVSSFQSRVHILESYLKSHVQGQLQVTVLQATGTQKVKFFFFIKFASSCLKSCIVTYARYNTPFTSLVYMVSSFVLFAALFALVIPLIMFKLVLLTFCCGRNGQGIVLPAAASASAAISRLV